MASLLKLIIDYPCQVYIDYELKADASPCQLLKIPLNKGKYVLELKSSNCLLYEQEYIMPSNDEEDLLRINIKEVVIEKGIVNESGELYDKKQITSAISKTTQEQNIEDYQYINEDISFIKINGKWGIKEKTECIYDEILYRGFIVFSWKENGNKYIGFINDTGIIKREVSNREIMTECYGFNNEKDIIIIETVIDDGKIDIHNIGDKVSRNIYVYRNPKYYPEGKSVEQIVYAFTCCKIYSFGFSKAEEERKENKQMRVWQLVDNRQLYGVYSFDSMSFVEKCRVYWWDGPWTCKYNIAEKKEELYYKKKLVAVNDHLFLAVKNKLDDTIIAGKKNGANWAYYDTNQIQLSMPLFPVPGAMLIIVAVFMK